MITEPQPTNRTIRLSLGLLALLPPSLCFWLVIVPFYAQGINRYSHTDINLQRVPGYPYNGPLVALVVAFSRPLMLFFMLGLLGVLWDLWVELTKYERLLWSIGMFVTLLTAGIIFSPLGGAMITWILD